MARRHRHLTRNALRPILAGISLLNERPRQPGSPRTAGAFHFPSKGRPDIVSELIKQRFRVGHEIHVILPPAGLQPIEIKSSATFAPDWTDALKKWARFTTDTSTLKPILIYGGADSYERGPC